MSCPRQGLLLPLHVWCGTYNSQAITQRGLTATYWRDTNHDSTNNDGPPVLVRNEPAVSIEWRDGSPMEPIVPADWFGVFWTGFLQVPVTGTYQFAGVHDDSARITVNGAVVYANGSLSDVAWQAPTVSLTAGTRVPIKVEVVERTGWARMHLFVRTSDGTTVPAQIVPASWLFPEDTPALPERLGRGAPSAHPPELLGLQCHVVRDRHARLSGMDATRSVTGQVRGGG